MNNFVYHLKKCSKTTASRMFLQHSQVNKKIEYVAVDDIPELNELDLPLFVPDKSSGIEGWSGYNPEKLKEWSDWLNDQ